MINNAVVTIQKNVRRWLNKKNLAMLKVLLLI
jgi:hypothetical protein